MVALAAAGIQDGLAGERSEPVNQLLIERPPEGSPEGGSCGNGFFGEKWRNEEGEDISAAKKHFACLC